ncbi:MAG: alpha/beta fold hydrolase [Candidatus Mcinerneyibacterium aminivorans]|uniref:Alpha/beta fold hydrolase n=1 Tax=Candidatus Mcinerneyibacterium aminivorans TaxID=2703815 RepID=A0A5D0MGL5_9BACT|nr:MAG: alpha/beta fold hydrolase [Candidatus Mcinerneyibacterium aminivorans]
MEINYRNNSKNLILMVHGFSGYPGNLEYLAEKLNEALSYDILVPQLPGHTDKLEDLKQSNHKRWIEKIDSIVEKKKDNYENIYMIGFSMGTLIATIVANRYKEVEKMILIAPPFAFPLKKEILLFLAPGLKLFKKYHYKEVEGNKLNKNLYDEEMRKKYPVKFEKEPLESVIEFNKLRKEGRKSYKNNKTPFLVIQSTGDRVAAYNENQEFLRKNIGSTFGRFVSVDDSGHMIPLDYDRDKVVAETIKFIEEDLSWIKI